MRITLFVEIGSEKYKLKKIKNSFYLVSSYFMNTYVNQKIIFKTFKDKEEFEKLSESIKTDLSPQNEIENAMAERIVLCLWKLRCGMNAEGEIIKPYAKLEGIDWQGLLESNYLGKICRYERRIMNYLDRLLGGFKDRFRTQKIM